MSLVSSGFFFFFLLVPPGPLRRHADHLARLAGDHYGASDVHLVEGDPRLLQRLSRPQRRAGLRLETRLAPLRARQGSRSLEHQGGAQHRQELGQVEEVRRRCHNGAPRTAAQLGSAPLHAPEVQVCRPLRAKGVLSEQTITSYKIALKKRKPRGEKRREEQEETRKPIGDKTIEERKRGREEQKERDQNPEERR